MKIGILGGTFDPIHQGHLKLAEAAANSLNLDKVVFMPCHIPPHKNRGDIAGAQDRLEMIRLAIEDLPRYQLSDYEIARGGTSFSIETLANFKKTHAADHVFFIIGSDLYRELATWRGHETIPRLVTIAVAERPSHPCGILGEGVVKIKMNLVDISSSRIRSLIKQKSPIKGLVPQKVKNYIVSKNLYAPKT